MKKFRVTMYLRTNTEWDHIAECIEEAIIAQGYLVNFSENEFIEVDKVEETD